MYCLSKTFFFNQIKLYQSILSDIRLLSCLVLVTKCIFYKQPEDTLVFREKIDEQLITAVSFLVLYCVSPLSPCTYLGMRHVEHAAKAISGCTLVKIVSTCSVKCAVVLAGVVHVKPVRDVLFPSTLFSRLMDLCAEDESLPLVLFAEVQSIYHTTDIPQTRYITTPSLYHTARRLCECVRMC